MEVQVWSDFACPYCYIGKHNLAQAIASLPEALREQITVVNRSFELAPDAEVNNPQSKYEQLAQKYGVTIARAQAMGRQATSMAESMGLVMDYDAVVMTNTFAAHQLAHLAAAEGKGTAMEEALFRAHFVEGKHIGDLAVLQTLGEAQGLAAETVAAALGTEQYGAAVRADEALAQRMEITGVPFVVLADRYAVSGAQSTDYFVDALTQVLAEGAEVKPVDGSAGGSCAI